MLSTASVMIVAKPLSVSSFSTDTRRECHLGYCRYLRRVSSSMRATWSTESRMSPSPFRSLAA